MILGFRGWGTCVQLDNLWLIPNLQTRAGPREAHPGKTTCLGMCVLLVAVSPARERHSGDSSPRLQQTQCPWKHQGATARWTCYLSQPCLNFPGCKMGVMTATGQPRDSRVPQSCPQPGTGPPGHVSPARELCRSAMALPCPWPILSGSRARRCGSQEEKVNPCPPGGAPPGKGSKGSVSPPGTSRGRTSYPPRLPTAPAPRWETPSSLAKKKKLASLHICKVKAQKALYKPKALFSRAYSLTE